MTLNMFNKFFLIFSLLTLIYNDILSAPKANKNIIHKILQQEIGKEKLTNKTMASLTIARINSNYAGYINIVNLKHGFLHLQVDLTTLSEQEIIELQTDLNLLCQYFSSVKIINCKKSFLKYICYSFPELKKLDLSDNTGKFLTKKIIMLKYLNELDLSNSSVSKIPVWFSYLYNLQKLDISYNNLTDIHELLNVKKLSNLNITHSQITQNEILDELILRKCKIHNSKNIKNVIAITISCLITLEVLMLAIFFEN